MKFFSKLKAEIQAKWRRRAREEMERGAETIPPDFREQEPGDGELQPPESQRVAARAGCVAAVALRGLANNWPHEEPQKFLPALNRWFSASGLDQEIESGEREILQAPPSELDSRGAINACWRWEGAAVLAASLGRIALPPHDETIDTQACGDACGLMVPRPDLDRLIANAVFDSNFDRFAYANQVLAIHWRLRQFVHVEQKVIDFAEFARGVQWAEFNLRGVELCDGDLAIRGRSINSADPDEVQLPLSIASERHLAANWLIGWDPIYSQVENPT